MQSLTALARHLQHEPRLVLVVTRDLGCDQATSASAELSVTRLRAPSPSTHAAALATLMLGVPPCEHGIMGEEIFVRSGSLSARDGRLSRRERRYYRHYVRHGWLRVWAAHAKRVRLQLLASLGAMRQDRQPRALWGQPDHPFLHRLLGLEARGERLGSLGHAFARVDESAFRGAKVARGPWIVLGHTFGLGNPELLRAFADWSLRSPAKLTRLLVSTNGCVAVDHALMFTQGEIVSLMSRGVFLCLSGRWCGVYGAQSRTDEVAALFADKFADRVRFEKRRPELGALRSSGLTLPFAVATARGSRVFAYEEIPAPFASGGDSELERTVPLVRASATPWIPEGL